MYLTQGLHRAVQQQPAGLATVFGDRSCTFGELGDRVARLAGLLYAAGLRPGDRLALLAHNSDRYLELLLAVWWAGGVAAPLNTRWSIPEIAYALRDSGARLLVVDGAFAGQSDVLRAEVPSVERVLPMDAGCASSTGADLPGWDDARPVADAHREGQDLAAIVYTGGTTGFPKGVMLSHANLWCGAMARLAESYSPPDSVALLVSPMFHVSGLFRFVTQIVIGGTNIVEPHFRPGRVLQAIERHGVTDAVLVPSMLQSLLDDADISAEKVRSLRRISCGGAPVPPALLERALATLPDVEINISYGMTETSGVISVAGPFTRSNVGSSVAVLRSVGRAGCGAEVRIIDVEGRPVPHGTVGEIAVRGPSVMQGYWNKPAETAAALQDGWLHTGDGAWMDDEGRLFIADRLKDMIITGGENVFSAEVEAVLMQHPAVVTCAVIGVPSEQWGEAVHAVIVLREGARADDAALRQHCRKCLAGYKCPKTFGYAEALPTSAAGKVLKNRLREQVKNAAASSTTST
jgi:long-chain acyl-CoA synthetase